MYYLFTSCLVLFFLFSLFHPLPCASSTLEWCDTLYQCGNITVGFPFWGKNRVKLCNHLELQCNSENITSLNISNHLYHVLHINQASNTLILRSANLQGPFCTAEFTNATFPPEIFELSPNYKNLTVFYHCELFRNYHMSYTCLKLGLISVSESPDFPEGCHESFTVNVPSSFNTNEKNLHVSNLESALKKGFELKVKIRNKTCEECSLHKSPGLSTGTKAGIAIAGVGFLFVIAAAILFCIARRRKKTQNAQYTSKDLPITPYSSIAAASGMVGKCQRKKSDDLEQNYLKALIPVKHYSYAQVRRISKSFSEVVGKGGFGTVYKGTLCDGRIVAVKILKDSKGNGEDFINEVASISKTSHVNIVSLLGFCSEGSKRAIIYEYLENRSLDQYISKNASMKMDWMEMYRIALGVARGLEYLHHGCKTRIVHFDIKPQNILLDDNLCPKVSDFGLAKLCEKKESILSLLDTRGTIGYIAPEVFSRMYGPVSHKSDVYSYGMLVLEMIGARERTSTENSASNPSSMYFPEWIYKEFEKGDDGRPYGNGITCKEEEIEKKMKLVGLWCVQPSPSDRPPMNRVVEMMEGNLNALEVPPRPGLQIPAAPLVESSTLGEDISVYNEV